MTGERKFIIVLLGALVVCAVSRADMMPLGPAEVVCPPPAQIGSPADLHAPSLSSPWTEFSGIPDIGSSLIGFLPQADFEAGQRAETQPARILTDRQNSLTLCLYGLLGLGLCRSAPIIKKVHFGSIPDWYHSGSPFQIGPSFAISPDCHPSAPLLCFFEPDSGTTTGDILPQFRRGIVVSLWRQSQFAPATLAPRGPPHLS